MSIMDEGKRPKRVRRSFTDEFKVGAVRLVLDEGKTILQVARDLDLTESALRTWVERARADRTQGKTGLTTVEREELARLRKENRELPMEREILEPAAAFFAKDQHLGSASSTRRRRTTRSGSSAVPSRSRPQVITPGASGRPRCGRSTIFGWRCSSARRTSAAARSTAARAFTPSCRRRSSRSAASTPPADAPRGHASSGEPTHFRAARWAAIALLCGERKGRVSSPTNPDGTALQSTVGSGT